MVSGGFDGVDRLKSVEALYSNGNSLCSLPDFPSGRYWHTLDGFTACGGVEHKNLIDNCITLSNGQWKESHQLLRRRHGHLSWKTGDELILVGGYAEGIYTNTEILRSDTSTTTEGFTLRYETEY